ncbi:MAG: hypothetical protein ABJE10_08935 [bacterium]
MRTSFQSHEGVRICHLDFTHITTEAIALSAVAEAKTAIAAEPPRSVYTITDVTGSRAARAIRGALHDLTEHNKPYVLFGAVVGATPLQTIVLRGIIQLTGRHLVTAETIKEAIEAVKKEAKSSTSRAGARLDS